MFQYALFDLDGTLTDPKVGITTCVQYALHYYGIEEELDQLTPFIGPPLKDSFMEYYGFDENKALEAIKKYHERFSTVGLYENEIYEGMAEMLCKLRDKGMKLAVASSKPTVFVEKILKHFRIDTYFDVVVGSELDGRRTDKREVVKEALEQLGVNKNNRDTCVMIGDRKFDIIGAKAEHINSVGVAYGYALDGELEGELPDYIAKTVQELQDYLLEGKIKTAAPADKNDVGACAGKTSFYSTLRIIIPILVYYLVYNFTILIMVFMVQMITQNEYGNNAFASFLAKHSEGGSVLIQFLAMAVGAGVLIPSFRREKPLLFLKQKKIMTTVSIILTGVFTALFFNVLFSLLRFTNSSGSYMDIAESQFSNSIISGLFLFGIISPIAEEIVFRGIVYSRLRKSFPFAISLIMSGLLFGVYHGNIVQGVYGFILGIVITWAYEQFKSFIVPVLIHAAANISVYLVMNVPILRQTLFTPMLCVLMGVLAVLCFFSLQYEIRKK